MHRVLIALLILSPATAAQTIYTCRPASGSPSYQTQPCAPSQTHVKAKFYPYILDRPAPAATQRTRAPWSPTSTPAFSRSSAAPIAQRPSDRTLQREQCASAKDARARAFEAAGLNRTFDLSRHWDDAVYQACKGL